MLSTTLELPALLERVEGAVAVLQDSERRGITIYMKAEMYRYAGKYVG